MFIPRSQFSSAYSHLKAHAVSATTSVLILCALDTDSLCATRILTHLLKRDYIRHQIKPVAGYQDLERVNEALVKDKEDLKFIICLGLGGLVDLSAYLQLQQDGREVECWIVDGRRPWNLYNVFASGKEDENAPASDGRVGGGRHGVGRQLGGVKCFDDGDIEEDMKNQGEAFRALLEMPAVDDDSDSEDGFDSDDDGDGGVGLNGMINEEGSSQSNARKRKSSNEPDDSDDESRRVRRRRTGSNSSDASDRPEFLQRSSKSPTSSPPPLNSDVLQSSPPPALPPRQPTARQLRRKLRRLRTKHETTVAAYYAQGTWYGEPISGLLYSLASDLGREDNDLLWLAIVGVCSGEIYGRFSTSSITSLYNSSTREEQIRSVLRDEVRRLNPPDTNPGPSTASASLQATARSPSDTAIRISPEYRFMMIRHWSLYDSMLHSSYLGTKLHIWSEKGKKRLHKLLAKMGFSLAQCRQSYTHMDMDLKRTLRDKLERYAPLYGLEGVVREGFTRCWGWRGCLSAADVGYVIGGILEVGKKGRKIEADSQDVQVLENKLREEKENEEWVDNFWQAYDALESIVSLKAALPIAMELHRAILRTGTALIEKRQIRLLRAFRLAVVKEGPDLDTFSHPAALSKLGLWLSEAVAEQESNGGKARHLPLVVSALYERRGVYIVVGCALGAVQQEVTKRKEREKKKKEREKKKEERRKKKEADGEEESEPETEEESDEEDDDEPVGKNKFSIAFQDVADKTSARIRIDSFEATVVEVKKEDLAGFLEALSMKSVLA